MKNVIKENQKIPYLFLLMLFSCLTISAQKGMTVRGTVFDSNGETIIGASVVLKGNNSIGTISDIDGNFMLTVPNENSTLEPNNILYFSDYQIIHSIFIVI